MIKVFIKLAATPPSPASFSLSSNVVIPAVVALTVSVLTLFVTYITSDRRARYDAAFEAAKYREKWLSSVREEIVEFCTLAVMMAVDNKKSRQDINSLFSRKLRIQLSIPPTNPNFKAFCDAADIIYTRALEPKDLTQSMNLQEITSISHNILKSEWDEIQQLLATGIEKEKRKNNVKNQ